MNPFVLALLSLAGAFISTKLLKYFSTAVPVVLIGLPVILAGLGSMAVLGLAMGFGLAAQTSAALSLVGAIGSFAYGCKLTSAYFTEAMKK